MDDTVGDENVGNEDLGAVDEDGAVGEGDGDVISLQGFGGGAVHEHGAVKDGAFDDWSGDVSIVAWRAECGQGCEKLTVVAENGGELIDAEVADGGTDVLEGHIVGHEDGEVGSGVDGRDEFGLGQSTGGGTEAGCDGGGGDVLRNGEDGVDDVDNAAGEVGVLLGVSSVSEFAKGIIEYGCLRLW